MLRRASLANHCRQALVALVPTSSDILLAIDTGGTRQTCSEDRPFTSSSASCSSALLVGPLSHARRGYHHYVYQKDGLEFINRMERHIAEARERLKKRSGYVGISKKNVELLPVRVLREELRLARVGAVGGLKKSELVSRIWGLMEVTFKNAEVLQELEAEGNVTSPLSMQTRWSRIEKEHGPATYSGLGPSDEENDLALRPGDKGSGMKRPHGTLPFPDAHVLSEQCVRFLAKMRCRDIMVMDVKELANWTDFMVVATGADVEHVWRCSGGLMYQLKRWDPSVKWGETLIDGAPGTEWVNIEFRGKAMINIMTREAREEYDLEELWMKKDRSNVVTYKGVEERRTYTLDELASE